MAKASSFTKVSVIMSMTVEERNALVAGLLYIKMYNEEFTDTGYKNMMEILRSLQEAAHGENTMR